MLNKRNYFSIILLFLLLNTFSDPSYLGSNSVDDTDPELSEISNTNVQIVKYYDPYLEKITKNDKFNDALESGNNTELRGKNPSAIIELPNLEIDTEIIIEKRGLPISGGIITPQLVSWISQPDDLTYIEGTTGNEISWTADDDNSQPGEVTLWKDGVQDFFCSSGCWDSGVPVLYNIDGLPIGTYNYTIRLDGKFSHFAMDTVVVTVTENNSPIFSQIQGNITYNEGTTGYEIVWNSTDQRPDNYDILQNGFIITSGSWNNADFITYNVDGLTKGTYNFTIVIYDQYDNFASNTTWIIVLDQNNPVIVSSPSNFTYEEGTTGNSLSWTVNDNHPFTFMIYRNNSNIFSGGWLSGFPITIGIDNLSVGAYNYTILVNDESANSDSNTTFVTVEDNVTPTLVSGAEDVSYAGGTTGHTLSWTYTDNNPLNYILLRDNIQIDTNIWYSSGSITINIDGLPDGIYNYTIVVYDISNNSRSDSAEVTVADSPVFTFTPSNYTYTEGGTDNTIEWILSDTNPDTYAIYRNGFFYDIGTWNNEIAIEINIDGFSVGVYNFTIQINDTDDNMVSHTMFVEVTDIPSWISQPNDTNYNEGSGGNTIVWIGSDDFPNYYKVFLEGSLYFSSTWQDNTDIILDIDGLDKGSYTFEIYIFDTFNNSISDSVILTVYDNTNPSYIYGTGNYTYFEGDIGNIIQWNFTDNYPSNYTIYNNETIFLSSSWSGTGNITINVDSLPAGVHIFEIIVEDASGNLNSNSTKIRVIDNTAPYLSIPTSNFIYIENSEGNTVEWSPIDLYPGSYDFYLDSSFNETNTWSNSSVISIDIDNLTLGVHNLTIQIFDDNSNSEIYTVWVTVIEITPPNISFPPENATLSEVGLNHLLSWTVSDDHPSTYKIYKNGTEVIAENWNSTTPITFAINSLIVGYHNFTIVIYDTSGNIAIDSVFLSITDGLEPEFTQVPLPSYLINEGSENNILTWKINDTNPNLYEIFTNGSSTINGTWFDIVSYSIDHLERGIYNITIIVYDKVGKFIVNNTIITVLDIVTPTIILTPDDFSIPEGEIGSTLSWIAIDGHPVNYVIEREGQIVLNGNWVNNSAIIYLIPFLSLGSYNFTIIIYDDSGNYNYDTLILTIYDNSSPQLISMSTNLTFEEGEANDPLQWQITDAHADQYEIYIDGNLQFLNTWISNVPITYSIDFLLKGTYNVSIYVFDGSSNYIYHSLIVTVIDTSIPTFVYKPSNFKYLENDNEIIVNWTVSDNYPNNYEILKDDAIELIGIWESGVPIEFSISDLLMGVYNYTIILWDETGNIHSHTLIITVVDETNPIFLFQPVNETINLGTTSNIIEWKIYDNHPKTYLILRDGIQYGTNIWSNEFLISINLDDLVIGTYNFTILVYDQSDNYSKNTVIVRIKHPETVDTMLPNIEITRNVYEGDVEVVTYQWLDINGSAVTNASVSGILIHNNQELRKTVNFTDSQGYLILIFDYNDLPPGNYSWKIELEKQYYQTQIITLDFQIKPHNYIIEIESLSELTRGESFEIVARVYYNNSRASSSNLGLNQLNPKEGVVEGIIVFFRIKYIPNDGSDLEKSIIIEAQTASNGIAVVRLSSTETNQISSISSLSASIEDNPYGEPKETYIGVTELPIIIDEDPDAITSLIDYLREFLILIIIIISIPPILLTGLIKFRKRKRKNLLRIMDDMNSAKIEIEVLQSLQAVILQTYSGLPLYDRQFKNMGMDSVLISGMSSAISSFLNELDSEKLFGFETLEREGLSITSHKSDNSTFTLISKQKIPFHMLAQFQQAHIQLEKQFDLDKDRIGGVHQLNADKVEQIMESGGLKLSLLDNFKIDFSKIRQIKKNPSLSRLVRQKIDVINEFNPSREDNITNLNETMEFLKSKGIFIDLASSLISLIYMYNGLIRCENSE
ncbi:MAG: hypothetical protein GPJ54_21545 [Candidatus Heimdallarchaeota archaeon]|nr:hypothetical protein [Candidatus Heimdallarchaeota archaeon]